MKKFVLTGGPSSGKTSTLEYLGSLPLNLGLVPESAALLLGGGYPVPNESSVSEIRNFQQVILQVQHGLEAMGELKHPGKSALLLDRATLDGVGYWPEGTDSFLRNFSLDLERELARYSGVLFFDLPDEKFFGGLGPKRFHNYAQGRVIAERQYAVWSKHPKFVRIPAYPSLDQKKQHALAELEKLIRS